ncbi:MAG: ATP-binding protein [Bacteriovoracia bacterium]
MSSPRTTLRQRILFAVFALMLLSFAGSAMSLFHVTDVNRSLTAINRVSVPLGRTLGQLKSDSEVLRREMERRLGYSHWNDPHWKPQAIPLWITDLLETEIKQLEKTLNQDIDWAPEEIRAQWKEWARELGLGFARLKRAASQLYQALEQKNEEAAARLYPQWLSDMSEWNRQLKWGLSESDNSLRRTFGNADARVSSLRTGLQGILILIMALSLLLFWFGERALRPLAELTRLARDIATRGLRKEDKSTLPFISTARDDEVSHLAREFQRMTHTLWEREKTVETQQTRLAEQNEQLREMGGLNENILTSIKSALFVTDPAGRVTQCNPAATAWLGSGVLGHGVIGKPLDSWPKLAAFLDKACAPESWREKIANLRAPLRFAPIETGDRIYGGSLMPLQSNSAGQADPSSGAILVLEDVTEEQDLQRRLQLAENLAAVGRLSAQVAHEVRNPLHSIGLEAEMALEAAQKVDAVSQKSFLKQSIQSILASVERLDKITENYLKLSRLSSGKKQIVDLGVVLEGVLATYATTLQSLEVRSEWHREPGADLIVSIDRDLFEQALGNLLRNSLQAMQEAGIVEKRVTWRMGGTDSGKVWICLEDNGPGVSEAMQIKLFQPFQTSRANGTGLGLSFVKRVMEEQGGEVTYAPGPEGGARFLMVLPAAVSQAAALGRPQVPPEAVIEG